MKISNCRTECKLLSPVLKVQTTNLYILQYLKKNLVLFPLSLHCSNALNACCYANDTRVNSMYATDCRLKGALSNLCEISTLCDGIVPMALGFSGGCVCSLWYKSDPLNDNVKMKQ